MDNKEHVMPIATLRRVVGLRRIKYKKVIWHTSELVIKSFLTIKEYFDTINNILMDCADKDGFVVYEMVDFATKLNIIISYALIELPDDIDELYYIAYESDLFKTICATANKDQIDSIVLSVDMCVRNGVSPDDGEKLG